MKIFRFFPYTFAEDGIRPSALPVKVLPDTALLIQKRPFFIPDFTSDCVVQLCYAVRINRLGRSIHEKFAHRYYDPQSVMLGTHFVARDLLRQLQSESLPDDIAVGFDNAVVLSDTRTVGPDPFRQASVQIADRVCSCPLPSDLLSQVDRQIAAVSRFYTLKQGDVLLLPLPLEEVQVAIDQRITLLLDDAPLVSFNVK